ncbi:MAG: hypothetical protein ACRDZZ_07355, partial [Ilumatobacteraceae bacterium]
CVAVPSAAAALPVPPASHLRVVPVLERYGLVWMSPGRPAREPCCIELDGDPAYRRINSGVDVWQASATRMVDNFLDVAHFPYVHVGTFGAGQDPVVAAVEVVDLDADFTGYRYDVDVADQRGATTHREMSTGFHLPFTVRSTIRYASGLDHVLLLCSTPIDDVTSYFTFVVWRNDANDDAAAPAEKVIAFDRAIGAEDKAMLERVPGALALDRAATVSVQSDRASLAWRRQLADLLAAGS